MRLVRRPDTRVGQATRTELSFKQRRVVVFRGIFGERLIDDGIDGVGYPPTVAPESTLCPVELEGSLGPDGRSGGRNRSASKDAHQPCTGWRSRTPACTTVA